MRRSLIIGLGPSMGDVLAGIKEFFKAQKAPDNSLETLWLTSGTVEDTHDLDVMPLTLTHKDLSALYFTPEVAQWSGPNWRDWKDSLLSNRLYGKLALYQHRRSVADRIIDQINRINRDDSLPLNLYLLAPLHDPFASGAFLDLAYLLNHIALTRKGRVYGVLFVPDTEGDPIMQTLAAGEGGDESSAANLSYATAYAALRELNFALGEMSFYQSQHPDPLYQVETHRESPFQSGDCYLLGGHLDEAKRHIRWQTVQDTLAEWVYLQTCTKITDHLSTTETNRSMISCFGLTDEKAGEGQQRARQVDETIYLLLQYLLDPTVHAEQPDINVERWFSPRAATISYDEFYGVMAQTPEETFRSPFALRGGDRVRKDLTQLDEQCALAVDILRGIETELANTSRMQLGRALPEIKDELTNWRSQQGITFPALESTHTHISHQAFRLYRRQRDELTSVEQETSDSAETLKSVRGQMIYAGRGYPFTQTIVPLALLILLLFAAVLIQAALPITLLLWLVLGIALPAGLIMQMQNRRARRTRRAYVETLRKFLESQKQLIEVSVLNAYQHDLQTELRQALFMSLHHDGQASAVARVAHIRETCETLLQTFQQDTENPVRPSFALESLLIPHQPAMAPKVIDALWARLEQDGQLTPDSARESIAGAIEKHLRVRLETNETDTLLALITPTIAASGTLLATKDTLIDERERRDTNKIIGLIGWSAQAISELGDTYQGGHVRLVDLDPHDDTPDMQQTREIITVSLRHNIPIRAVLDIDQWRHAYQRLCYVRDLDLTYRSFMHPTRAGIASPEIRVPPANEVENLPAVIMAFCMLLHVLDKLDLAQALCRLARVESDAGINFDELCGALQENPDILIEDVLPTAVHTQDEQQVKMLRNLWNAIEQFEKPRVSERYADWEVWIFEAFAALLNSKRQSVRLLAALTAAAELHHTEKAHELLKRAGHGNI